MTSRSAEHRQARRDAVRRWHPDAGGDARALQEALAHVDVQYATPRDTADTTAVRPPRRTLRARRRRLVRRVRALRARLPRGVPGARRFVVIDDRHPHHRTKNGS